MRKMIKLSGEFYKTDVYHRIHGLEVEFYIDIAFQDALLELLKDKTIKKKFRYILELISLGKATRDLYGNEEVCEVAKDVFAMKIKSKDNLRIICKEIRADRTKIVIAADYFFKKGQKLIRIQKALIAKVGGYEYEV